MNRRVVCVALAVVFVVQTGSLHLARSAPIAFPSASTSPTGDILRSSVTTLLKARVPATTGNVNVLLVGQGVDSKSFPTDLRTAFKTTASSGDLSDPFGYGTLAASAILQLVPSARIYAYKVLNVGGVPQRIDLAGLGAALNYALDSATKFDVVLLAFAPESAMDPLLDAASLSTYGASYGTNLDLAINAILERTADPEGGASGIPLDGLLRDQFLARADMRERDAVEQLVARYIQWQAVLKAVKRLDDAGVPIVAPAGDYPIGNPSPHQPEATRTPAYPQSIFGLSALSDVITVGSAYEVYDGDENPLNSTYRIAPSSGTGPTIALRQKPDIVAPASVVGLVPNASTIGAWLDAYDNAPTGQIFTPRLEWGSGTRDCTRSGGSIPSQARDLLPSNVASTLVAAEAAIRTATAPITGAPAVSHCVLQGSSIVSASIVAANISALIGRGIPHTSASRAATDDEVLLRLVQASASQKHTLPPPRSPDPDEQSVPWREGAGLFFGAGNLDAAAVPVPLGPLDFGEVACRAGFSQTVALWPGGAQPTSASAQLDSLLWADEKGEGNTKFALRPGVSAATLPGAASVTLDPGDYPGGFYAGHVELVSSNGTTYAYPVSVTQDICPSFRTHYAYTNIQTGSVSGELAEDVTIGLYPTLPPNTGPLGPAFKYLQELGISPTDRPIRFGVTKGGSIPATLEEPYGVATIRDPGVPPGYWRYQLGGDYTVEGMQVRDELVELSVPDRVKEGIGVKLGGGGPNVASIPGATLPVFIPSAPGCDDGYVANYFAGVACGSPSSFGLEQEPSTGLCYASSLGMLVYCGRASMAVPGAFTSRAVHLVEYNQNQALSELKTCVVGIDTDSGKLDLDNIARAQSRSACTTNAGSSTWSFAGGAPDCLGPDEQAFDLSDNVRDGLATDVTASYQRAIATTGSSAGLPVGVLTYRFAVPAPNTLTTIGVNFAYKVNNAIIAVRAIGQDPLNNATGSLLVVRDDPNDPHFDMSGAPKIQTVPGAGTVHGEWTMLSAGATWGSLTFLIIPTTLISNDFAGEAAKVQLCDIGVRVKTYAKQAWGKSGSDAIGGLPSPVQRAQMRFDHPASSCSGSPDRNACRLSTQVSATGPAKRRMRTWFDPIAHVFKDLSPEYEDVTFLVHVPKDTMLDANTANTHRVRPEAFPFSGGPAYLGSVRSGQETQSFSYPSIFDPGLGSTAMSCQRPAVCSTWNNALAESKILLPLPTTSYVNGRFFGVASLGRATLSSADGVLTWLVSDTSDSGATLAAWRTEPTPIVSAFFGETVDDKLTPPNDIRVGTIQLYRDPGTQKTMLALDVRLAAGDRQIIKISLGCVSSPGGVQCV